MSFSINTNVASLQAQNYLRTSSDFQSKTINRVTSGLRIVQSGDDAAGLAIANGFRSDQAVLNQGIRNANDGLSALQIADGGMNNISTLLDRARTLATQSASGTFTGDRNVLNSEFQSVMSEIDRQAQAIGLNMGGSFAKDLSVFIGGGKGSTDAATISNGSVSLDLSKSTVDTQSLGMKGFTAGFQNTADTGLYDLGASSATSVSAIVGQANNIAGLTGGNMVFNLSGAGFSGLGINVNVSGVNDTSSLVSAINAALQGAASAGTAAAAALKAANVVASVHTGKDGAQQLVFTSASSTFSVAAGDIMANAFLGNFNAHTGGTSGSATPQGAALDNNAVFVAGGTQQYRSAYTSLTGDGTSPDTQTVTFTAIDSTGAPQTTKVTLTAGATTPGGDLTAAGAAAAINTVLQATNVPSLQGIVATASQDGTSITFSSSSSSKFTMSFGGETGVDAGKGFTTDANTVQKSSLQGIGATADISNQTSAQAAVSALAAAVTKLGQAQAVVGKGENQFAYAVNLAQSQVSNIASAESRIRDADLAAESANLTKAQILIQAGVAALAQANSAPQQVLTLLRA